MKKERGLVNSKRGSEMTIGTIVIIIIALVVLIFLIVVFTKSTGSFSEKISSFLGVSNVDTIKDSCNLLVSQNSEYEYCCVNKTIKLSFTKKVDLTCEQAKLESWGSSINSLKCEGAC